MLKNFWRTPLAPRRAALVVATLLAWALGLVVLIATPFSTAALWGIPPIPVIATLAAAATYRRLGPHSWTDAIRVGGLAIGLLWLQVVALTLLWMFSDGPLELMLLAGVGATLLVRRRRRRAAAGATPGRPGSRTGPATSRRASRAWAVAGSGAGLVALVALFWALGRVAYDASGVTPWLLAWLPGLGLGLAASVVYAVGGHPSRRDSIFVSMLTTGVVAFAFTVLMLVDMVGDVPVLGVILVAPILVVPVGLLALWVVGIPALVGGCLVAFGISCRLRRRATGAA